MSFLVSAVAATSRKNPLIRWAAGGWTFFILENVILSENRSFLIDQLSGGSNKNGDDRYHVVYGTLSTLASISIGYAYWKIRSAKPSQLPSTLILWKRTMPPPVINLALSWTFLSLGLVMASQVVPKMQFPVSIMSSQNNDKTIQFQVRCPFDFSDRSYETHHPYHDTVRGLERITRHPGLWSFGFIGLGQSCLANNVPLRIWWMGPVAVAWLGGWHTDSRFRRGLGGTLSPTYDCQTSNVPFVAMMTGKQGNSHECWGKLMTEIKPMNAAIGFAMSMLWVLRRAR